MTTLLQAVKQIVKLDNSLADVGYDASETMYSVFMSEYGNWHGFTQASVTEYVEGLPSIVSFPFYNSDILDELEYYGIERKTEKGRYTLIEKYWDTLGYVVFKMIEKEKNKKA